MSRTLCLRNRQRVCRIEAAVLRRIVRHLIDHQSRAEQFELGLHLVEAPAMARLNEKFLGHDGSTDVITFNYAQGKETKILRGDIFICLDEAVAQARQFRTTWQSELIRYAIHGLLHLIGFDDTTPAKRRRMKRQEDRWLRQISGLYDVRSLGKAAIRHRSSAV